MEVLGEPLPERLARRLLESADYAYPVELPVERQVSGGEAHKDRLVFTGEVRDLFAK